MHLLCYTNDVMPKKGFVLIVCLLVGLATTSISLSVKKFQQLYAKEESYCPVIRTTLGEIAGSPEKTILGNNNFCSYRGIRYAEPPIGQLRFKAPVPSGPWNGIYNAFEYGAACKQQTFEKFKMSEDCLFLNVFIPSSSICSDSSDIAVIVFLHGGGYVFGVANDNFYGPHLLLNECIIFVTLNYRLNVFGFLPLALDEYSGNMGLKDQQLALEWVNNHISAFGGIPKQVTLMGESAGSASVSLHRLNSKSRDLFKQAYAISSSALSFYTLSDINNKTDFIVKMAKKQNVNIENTNQLIEYIQTVDADYILNESPQFDFQKYTIIFDIPWQPNIEPKTAINPFITEDPEDLLANGVNVPTIYTHTPMESIAFLTDVIANSSLINYLNEKFVFTLPFHGIDQESCKKEIEPLFDDIRRFYFGDTTIDKSQMLPYIQLTTTVNFVYSIQREITIQAHSNTNAEIRLLRVNPRTALRYNRTIPNGFAMVGASHSDDICSYFWCESMASVYEDIKQPQTHLQKSTLRASKILREILTSFAITGDPVSKTASFNSFPSVKSQPLTKLPFVELLSDNTLAVGHNENPEEFEFWWMINRRVEEIKEMPCNH